MANNPLNLEVLNLTGKPGEDRDPVEISKMVAAVLLGDDKAKSVHPYKSNSCIVDRGFPSQRGYSAPTDGVIRLLLGAALPEEAIELYNGSVVTVCCGQAECGASVTLIPDGDDSTLAAYANLPVDCQLPSPSNDE